MGRNQRGAAKDLQVARRISEREPGKRRQFLDTPLSLTEMLQQLQTVWVAKRLRDLGETSKHSLLRSAT